MEVNVFAQHTDTLFVPYSKDFKFNEGVYLSFNEFKLNAPSFAYPLEKKGSDVYLKFSEDSLIEIDPGKVWGYAFDNNIYIASDGKFWKCINIGTLTQFTEIKVSSYITSSSSSYGYGYGYPNEVHTKSLAQSFLDMNDGQIKSMNYKNLKPYVENEPVLLEQIKKNRKLKSKDIILLLRYYNQLNPLIFSVYE